MPVVLLIRGTEVLNMVRRIAAILLLHPALDANYRAVKAEAYAWPAAHLGERGA